MAQAVLPGAVPAPAPDRVLRRRHERAERGRRLAAWALIAPSIAFMAVFFALPIVAFLTRAVDNTEVTQTLPRTVAAIAGWDRQDVPDEPVFAALAADLQALDGVPAAAALGRRLNHNVAGFRQLAMRSAANVPAVPHPDGWRATLIDVDARWEDPIFWHALYQERHPVTPLYLLASADLQRGPDGIERIPPDRRLFVDLLARTLTISAVVTLLCVVLGFPVAYAMASAGPKLTNWLLMLVLLPFWTSLLVRTTAWIILLQRNGLVNQGLESVGLIHEPLALIYNRLGVYVAMVHVLLPFMVLPLYSVMKGVNPDHMRAGAGLGAPPLVVFRRIYLPQVLPGVVAGASLVFVLALGYYITPALVGGPADQMIAYFIAYFTSESVNWGMGASLSAILLGVVVLLYAVLGRTIGLDRLKVR